MIWKMEREIEIKEKEIERERKIIIERKKCTITNRTQWSNTNNLVVGEYMLFAGSDVQSGNSDKKKTSKRDELTAKVKSTFQGLLVLQSSSFVYKCS